MAVRDDVFTTSVAVLAATEAPPEPASEVAPFTEAPHTTDPPSPSASLATIFLTWLGALAGLRGIPDETSSSILLEHIINIFWSVLGGDALK